MLVIRLLRPLSVLMLAIALLPWAAAQTSGTRQSRRGAAQPAQAAQPAAASSSEAPAASTATPEEKYFKATTWRQIGPFRGGRVLAVSGSPSQPKTYYFGGVAGGVWKTTDGGLSWTPMFDKIKEVSSIGSIAVSESDPNVIYVGTGEACIRGNIVAGNGMYKSVDSGKT